MNTGTSLGAMEGEAVRRALHDALALYARDAMFTWVSSVGDTESALERLVDSRKGEYRDAVNATIAAPASAIDDAYVLAMCSQFAVLGAPYWLPMGELVRERITKHAGAKGLRGLFTSKLSEKDEARIVRTASLALRVTRAIAARNEGPRTVRLVAQIRESFGLDASASAPLFEGAAPTLESIEVYGDLEEALARTLLRASWHLAATLGVTNETRDGLRALGTKVRWDAKPEALEAEAKSRVDARRAMLSAVLDVAKSLNLNTDRVRGTLKALCEFAMPPCYASDIDALTSAEPLPWKEHKRVSSEEKRAAFGVAWCLALLEDPTFTRREELRRKLVAIGKELGESPDKTIELVEKFVAIVWEQK